MIAPRVSVPVGASHRYVCHGLLIDSELALPEMEPDIAAAAAPHVRIRLGDLPRAGTQFAPQIGPLAWAAPGQLFLALPGVVRLLVRDGSEIVVTPEADADSVRVFLLGSGLGALLLQRGLTVLHGNAVRVGERCMVCVGPSGSGKSTLAAALAARGHSVLADDVVVADADGLVHPGLPRIQLWRDAVDRLGMDAAALRRVRPQLEKFDVPVAPATRVRAALRLGWLYELSSHAQPTVRVEPLAGMDRLELLRRNRYRPRFADTLQTRAEELRRLGALTAGARVARVARPRDRFLLDALADALLEEVAARP
jgi:hypothetical protein